MWRIVSKMKKGLFKNCLICGTNFKTYSCLIRDGRGKYCSKNCYVTSLIGRKLTEQHKDKLKKEKNK